MKKIDLASSPIQRSDSSTDTDILTDLPKDHQDSRRDFSPLNFATLDSGFYYIISFFTLPIL